MAEGQIEVDKVIEVRRDQQGIETLRDPYIGDLLAIGLGELSRC